MIQREPMVVRVKIGQTVFMGVLVLFLYWQAAAWLNKDGPPTQVELTNTLGACFFMAVTNLMNNYFGTVLVFQTERPVFLREQANKMYGVTPYYLSKMLTEMPVLFLCPLILELVVYWGIWFR